MTDYAGLTRFILEGIVDDQSAVSVEEHPRGKTIFVEISVAPDDAGKVIGRSGRNIESIRAVVRAAGLRQQERVQVELAHQRHG